MARDRSTFINRDSDRERKSILLKNFLDQLPGIEREALTRFYVLNQSSVQIHRELGIAPEELRELRTRARKAFRGAAAPGRTHYMSPGGVETLANPDPRDHIVFPYTHDAQVVEAICLFTSAGLRKGENVLLIMTQTHHRVVRQLLQEEINLSQIEAAGRLICVDAQHLLDRLMFDGVIDEQKFNTEIDALMSRVKATNADVPVRIFGEMVDLVWKSNPKATHRLEGLWNKATKIHPATFFCAYSLTSSHPTLSPALLAYHSHAIA